jgi:hypothetical protein
VSPHSYGDLTAPVTRPLDRDRLSMAQRGEVAMAAHRALDALQRETPEIMMMGAALLFHTLCLRCRVDPQEIHHLAGRVLRDQDGFKKDNDSLQSMRDFAGIRIMGEREVSIA